MLLIKKSIINESHLDSLTFEIMDMVMNKGAIKSHGAKISNRINGNVNKWKIESINDF